MSKASWVWGILFICGLSGTAGHARLVSFEGGTSASAELKHSLVDTGGDLPSVQLEARVYGVDVNDTYNGFHSVRVDRLVPMAEPGHPAVPVTGTLIAVPPGFEPELEIQDQRHTEIGSVVVEPFEHQSRCRSSQPYGFSFRSDLYNSNAVYPGEVIRLEEAGYLQDLRLVRVAVQPLQADMENERLIVHHYLKFRVHLKPVGWGSRRGILDLPKALWDMLKNLVANGDGLGETINPASVPDLAILVVADEFKDKLEPLMTWYRHRGIRTRRYTTSELGGDREKIKANLQKLYDQGVRPGYLLLIGNEKTMPAYFEKVTFQRQTAVTDYPYTLLSGDDIVPDVLFGRIVADSEEELVTQIQRWVQYESAPDPAGSWYRRAMTIASREGRGPSDEDYARGIEKILKAHHYLHVDRFFQGAKTATTQNILEALEEGRSWIHYFGHGNGTLWQSTNDRFSVAQIRELENYSRLPVIVDVACLNADYVRRSPAFGKAWVTQGKADQPAGAVAYYGGSVSITWHPPAVMATGITESHFAGKVPSLGGSILAGHLHLIKKMGTGNSVKDNLKWYNLFGNPALNIRTNTPLAYNVETRQRKRFGTVELTVQATDARGQGVGGLTVAAHFEPEDQPHAVRTTNAKGRAVFRLSAKAFEAGKAYLTLSGYNAENRTIELTSALSE